MFWVYNCHYEKIGSEVKNIEDEIDFDLPDGWSFVRINNFCTVVFSGKSPKYSKEETKHKVIGQQANQWEGVNLQYVKYCTEEFVVDMPELYYLQNGDVLLNTLGNGTLGRSGIFYNVSEQEKMLTDGHLFVFRNINITLSKYLLLYLRTKYDEIVKSANGSTNQTFLSLGRTLQWLIPVPPLNEMKRIVCELDKYEPLLNEYNLIETKKSKLDTEIYDKLKKSILQYAIQGKLVEQDENDEPASVLLERIRAEKKAQLGKKYVESYIYKGDDNCYYEHIGKNTTKIDELLPLETPSNWTWVRLGDICFVTKLAGFEYTKYIAPNLCVDGIPIFKGKNVQDGEIIYKFEGFIPKEISDFLERSQVRKKCILTPYVGSIGNLGIHNKEGIYHLGSNVGKIELLPYNLTTEEFIVLYLKSIYGYGELTKNKKATAQESISIEAIREVYIPLPPLAEQKRIVDKINEIFAKL